LRLGINWINRTSIQDIPDEKFGLGLIRFGVGDVDKRRSSQADQSAEDDFPFMFKNGEQDVIQTEA
jgi:hypothetical protein